MRRNILKNTCLLFITASAAAGAAGAELKLGRYVGSIEMDDTRERVALVTNVFVVQPEDFTRFPKMNATFKASLGGYGTPEYVTETFEDIRYDFNDGQLVLDEQANDLVITAAVSANDGETKVTGRVWIRSAAKWGALALEHESDEPGGGGPDDGASGPFMPLLRGQYEGLCGSERAAMQVATGKGIIDQTSDQRGLRGYSITARLALDQPTVCGDASLQGHPSWCVSRVFSTGSYNFFANQLVLDASSGSTSCSLVKGEMRCRIRMVDGPLSCILRRRDMASQAYKMFTRRYTVPTTVAQRAALPAPAPPEHAALVAALRGEFLGYLHNEANDRYQPFKLVVNPTVSTLNPHDENRIFVSTTAVTYFGRAASGEFWPHQLERRAFYLRPGFTLESSTTDGFLQIEEWRRGYVKGAWYSHAYGRVGTVQLVKQDVLPSLDEAASIVGSLAGEFEGRPEALLNTDLSWWFQTIFPTQSVDRDQSTFAFSGDSSLTGGIIRPARIEIGAYDVYAGAFSWKTAEENPRMILGQVDDAGELSLYWPGASIWGVRMSDFGFTRFERLSQ